jgi:hypothetical protein
MRFFGPSNQVHSEESMASTFRKFTITFSIFSALMAWVAARDPVGICLSALQGSIRDGFYPKSFNETWIEEKVAKCRSRQNLPALQNDFFIFLMTLSVASLAFYLLLRTLAHCQAPNHATLSTNDRNIANSPIALMERPGKNKY